MLTSAERVHVGCGKVAHRDVFSLVEDVDEEHAMCLQAHEMAIIFLEPKIFQVIVAPDALVQHEVTHEPHRWRKKFEMLEHRSEPWRIDVSRGDGSRSNLGDILPVLHMTCLVLLEEHDQAPRGIVPLPHHWRVGIREDARTIVLIIRQSLVTLHLKPLVGKQEVFCALWIYQMPLCLLRLDRLVTIDIDDLGAAREELVTHCTPATTESQVSTREAGSD
mmetsp:Transcript_926/g.2913  ORF Transcript_926/g.2913 Transcript_926/m.2913 type:complete len:220 (-) Transcript_926:48-707(-)